MLKVHIDAVISSKYIPNHSQIIVLSLLMCVFSKLAIKLFPINQVKIPSDYIKCMVLVYP